MMPLGYVPVRPNVWPQKKCRSLWPLFHGSVILPDNLQWDEQDALELLVSRTPCKTLIQL